MSAARCFFIAALALVALALLPVAAAEADGRHSHVHTHVKANGKTFKHRHAHRHRKHHRPLRQYCGILKAYARRHPRQCARMLARLPRGRQSRADRTPPTVAFVALRDGQTLSGVVPGRTCEVSAQDRSGVDYVDFSIDGQPLRRENAAPWICSADAPWDTSRLSAGNHVIAARAVDRRGNSAITRVSFTVAAPATTTTAPPTTADTTIRVPTLDAAAPLWHGSFENPIDDQWIDIQQASTDHTARTTTEFAREGTRSGRFELRPGDALPSDGTARQQVAGAQRTDGTELRFREGDDRYFGFSIRLASDYPIDSTKWQNLVAWKENGTGPGPLKLSTSFENGNFRLEGAHGVFWRGPLVRGAWLDFVVRVKFSSDPRVGFIEVWYRRPGDAGLVPQTLENGQKRHYFDTFEAGATHSYLKAGLYRQQGFTRTSVAWFDAFRAGTSFDSVAPRV